MLIYVKNKLHVYREGRGLRITIPTQHSSTILTQEESAELTKVLLKLFKKKSTEETK